MSQVHVIVTGDSTKAEAWAAAFDGAIDLYHFPTRREAFQRLASASASIDVLVLVEGDDEVFDMTAAQLAERIVGPVFAGSSVLGGMDVVLITGSAHVASERVHCVSSMGAAIRMVKYGEQEAAPAFVADVTIKQPAAADSIHAPAAASVASADLRASSVISRIWDAADRHAETARHGVSGGGPAAQQAAPVAADLRMAQPGAVRLPRGTSRMRRENVSAAALFAFAGQGVAMAEAPAAIDGALAPAMRHEPDLHRRPSNEYRGSAVRGGIASSIRFTGLPAAVPVPQPSYMVPGLAQSASQLPVQSMYAPQPIAHHGLQADPVLGFSSQVQRQLQPVEPVQPQAIAQPQLMPAAQPLTGLEAGMPLHPMAGMPAAAPAGQSHDLLARAEAGAASFG